MRYYKWIAVWEEGDIFIEAVDWQRAFDEYYLGQPIEAGRKRPTLIYRGDEDDRKPDLVPGIHLVPVASRSLQVILQREAAGDIELHPARLKSASSGAVDETFAVVHLLEPVAAMDRERSEYEADPEYDDLIVEITRLVLDPSALAGRHLVRLDETGVDVLVSEHLRSEMEAAGLTGMAFTDVEQ